MTGKAKKNYSGITVCQIRSMVDFCCSSLTLKSTQIYLSLLFMLFPVWPICGWYVKELYFTQNTVWGAELDLDSCSQDIKNHGRAKMERHSFTVWLGINSLAPYLRGGGSGVVVRSCYPSTQKSKADDLSTHETNLARWHIWKMF